MNKRQTGSNPIHQRQFVIIKGHIFGRSSSQVYIEQPTEVCVATKDNQKMNIQSQSRSKQEEERKYSKQNTLEQLGPKDCPKQKYEKQFHLNKKKDHIQKQQGDHQNFQDDTTTFQLGQQNNHQNISQEFKISPKDRQQMWINQAKDQENIDKKYEFQNIQNHCQKVIREDKDKQIPNQVQDQELLINSQLKSPLEQEKDRHIAISDAAKLKCFQMYMSGIQLQREITQRQYQEQYQKLNTHLQNLRNKEVDFITEKKQFLKKQRLWKIKKQEENGRLLKLKQQFQSGFISLAEFSSSVNPSQAQNKQKQEIISRLKRQLDDQNECLQQSYCYKTYLEKQATKLKNYLQMKETTLHQQKKKLQQLEDDLKLSRGSSSMLQEQNLMLQKENIALKEELNVKLLNFQNYFKKKCEEMKKQYKQDSDDQSFKQLISLQHQKEQLQLQLKSHIKKTKALQDDLKIKADQELSFQYYKADKDKIMKTFEEKTKQAANNLMQYLYSSIQSSEQNNIMLQKVMTELVLKDEQIHQLEGKRAQLEVKNVELQLQLQLCKQQKNYLDQQYKHSTLMIASYKQDMQSYKLKVQEFIQQQKSKFEKSLTNATTQFNKSLMNVSKFYEQEIEKEKQNQIKQSKRVQEMQEKFNQLDKISLDMKNSSEQLHRDYLQTLSKMLVQAQKQVKQLKKNAQLSEQNFQKQQIKYTQKQSQFKQKLAQKQMIYETLQKEKIFFEDSISKIQEKLQDKNFHTFAEQLIDSQNQEYHHRVSSLIISIYAQRCNYETRKYAQHQQQSRNQFQQSKKYKKDNQCNTLKLEHEQEEKILKAKIKGLEDELVKYRETITSKQAQTISINKQYLSVKTQLDKSKSQEKNKQNSSRQLETQRNKLRVNKEQLQKEVQILKKNQVQYKEELRKIKQSNINTITRQLRVANEKYLREKEKMEISTSALEKQINTLKKQKDIAAQQKALLQQKLSQMEDDSKNKNKRDNIYFTQINRSSNEYEMKYKHLQLQYTKHTSKSKELNERIVQLERENKRLKQTQNNQSQIQERQWKRYQQRVKQYEETIDNLRIEKQDFRKRYQEGEQKLKLKQLEIKKVEINRKSVQSKPLVSPMNFQKQLFVVSTILQDNFKGQQFLQRFIQNQVKPAKLINAGLLIKLSQATKNVSLSKMISRTQINNDNFLFLFSTKQSIFGALAFKKDSISKQIASIFSITNEKGVGKNSKIEATGLNIDFQDNLFIGSGHMKFRLNSKVLLVKDNYYKYFDAYDKKEIYGSSYWRDELNIQINEFQIYRINCK